MRVDKNMFLCRYFKEKAVFPSSKSFYLRSDGARRQFTVHTDPGITVRIQSEAKCIRGHPCQGWHAL